VTNKTQGSDKNLVKQGAGDLTPLPEKRAGTAELQTPVHKEKKGLHTPVPVVKGSEEKRGGRSKEGKMEVEESTPRQSGRVGTKDDDQFHTPVTHVKRNDPSSMLVPSSPASKNYTKKYFIMFLTLKFE
jgi:hypothetical protein